jgi:hypothetical protein
MKIVLAALAVLLFASLAQADTLSLYNPNDPAEPVSVLAIPDGSTITSETFIPPGDSAIGIWIVDYSFADGTGFAKGDTNDDVFGAITFTLPVSSVTFGWFGGNVFQVEAAGGGSFQSCVNSEDGCGIGSGVETLIGPAITGLTWAGYDPGYGGISSLAYNSDPIGAPEPSTYAMTIAGIFGLLALFGLARKSQV